VSISGITQPGDGTLPREYAGAGATWWLESIYGLRGDFDALMARVEAGPPL
jgi:hypothetical protein